jgi:transitional endoplasmic reticulum ATPase
MDGVSKSSHPVITIGTTSRASSIDSALRRAGRFDFEIEVPIPSPEQRLEILKIHAQNLPLHSNVNLEKIAGSCIGFVGADIYALCRETALSAFRRHKISKFNQEKAQLE